MDFPDSNYFLSLILPGLYYQISQIEHYRGVRHHHSIQRCYRTRLSVRFLAGDLTLASPYPEAKDRVSLFRLSQDDGELREKRKYIRRPDPSE